MQELKLESIYSQKRVQGLTHNFYRYPARFSPEFAREVINTFSQKNDLVLDAFMGGGTTIVEAIAAGRKVIGVDINSLAHFVTTVKTTPLSCLDKAAIQAWSDNFYPKETDNNYHEMDILDTKLDNLPGPVYAFLKSAIESLKQLQFPRQRRFVKCALLKVGQWSVDCRQTIPGQDEILTRLKIEIAKMLVDIESLADSVRATGIPKNKITNSRTLIQGSIADFRTISKILSLKQKPKLIITSPPYPGVHVLYHRWQVSGRKETSAPYWLTGLQDGMAATYYTMGGRSEKGIKNYFANLHNAFSAMLSVIDKKALIIQLIGFSDEKSQLPEYLQTMDAAGYEEVFPEGCIYSRQIRTVPHRKWYTNTSNAQNSSHEVLLFHSPKS